MGLHSCNQNVNTVEKPSVLMIKDIGELPQTGEAFPVQLWDRHLPGPAGGGSASSAGEGGEADVSVCLYRPIHTFP